MMVIYGTFNHRGMRKFVGGFAWPTFILFLGTCIVFLSSLFAFWKGHLPAWGLVLINSVCNFYSFTVLHEAIHENIEGAGRGKWRTSFMGWLSGAMFLAPFPAMRAIHLTHHQNTNDPVNDPDYFVASRYFISTILRCLMITPHYIHQSVFKIKMDRQDLVTNILTISLYWSFSVALCLTPLWEVSIYGIMLPAIFGTAIMALLFDWLPHHPHLERDPRLATRNYPNWFLNIILAGQNVHQLHHVNPRIPFFRYQKAFFATLLDGEASPQGNHAPMDQAGDF